MLNCTECNKPGGTVPKYHKGDGINFGDAVEMMHEDCAVRNIERYMNRKVNS